MGSVDLRQNYTSDFKNILDYDYVGPKHLNFLVHVFGKIWLYYSVIIDFLSRIIIMLSLNCAIIFSNNKMEIQPNFVFNALMYLVIIISN